MRPKDDIMSEKILNLVDSRSVGAATALRIDVIADLVCPWSYLGQSRLDTAMSAYRGRAEVTWYPFQLNPDMPAEGMDFEAYLSKKFGDPAAMEPALKHLTLIGQTEGAPFDFSKLRRVPNTLAAHRLMRMADAGDQQSEMAAALYRAFFVDGIDIGDHEALEHIGGQLGFSLADVRRALDDPEALKIVKAEEAQARRAGVTGVPNYLINKRLFVVGAQESASLLAAIDRATFGAESDIEPPTTLH